MQPSLTGGQRHISVRVTLSRVSTVLLPAWSRTGAQAEGPSGPGTYPRLWAVGERAGIGSVRLRRLAC